MCLAVQPPYRNFRFMFFIFLRFVCFFLFGCAIKSLVAFDFCTHLFAIFLFLVDVELTNGIEHCEVYLCFFFIVFFCFYFVFGLELICFCVKMCFTGVFSGFVSFVYINLGNKTHPELLAKPYSFISTLLNACNFIVKFSRRLFGPCLVYIVFLNWFIFSAFCADSVCFI